ncbi:MAG: alkaline phosphatase family protein [Clostridia bacterium]|nr:alkaline phosphatase family protein [Clostridia bacterium]
MKKKILIAVAVVIVILAAIAFPIHRYMFDFKDTEELFRSNVSSVSYGNSIETALPQTELYNTIKHHFEAPLDKGKTEKKAIIIGYDGCRADVLTEIVSGQSGIEALTKNGGSLNLSYCGGVNYPEENTQDTSTAPGWCSILTGYWADVHGITGNDITKTMGTKTLITSLVEEKLADSSVFITKWAGHFSRENATYLEEKAYCEQNALPASFVKCDDDAASFNRTLEEIAKPTCADFIFAIYEPTDSAGHSRGFTINNPKYKDAFKTEDAYALEVINAIKARATYQSEDWLIIITSDHGGIKTGHGNESIQERITFVALGK